MADDKAIWDPRNLAHGEAFSLPRGDGDETDDYVLECWTELDDVVYVFAFEEDHDVDTDEPPFLFRYDIDEDGVPGLDDVEEEALEDLLFSYWEAWVKNIGAATGIYPIHRETRTRYRATIDGKSVTLTPVLLNFTHDMRTYAMFTERIPFGDAGHSFNRVHVYEFWREDDGEHFDAVDAEDMPQILLTAQKHFVTEEPEQERNVS